MAVRENSATWRWRRAASRRVDRSSTETARARALRLWKENYRVFCGYYCVCSLEVGFCCGAEGRREGEREGGEN